MVEIKLVDCVQSEFCVASEHGSLVSDKIKEYFRSGEKVVLSLEGVDLLTSAFLNTAIGILYNDYSEDFIREHLSMKEGTEQEDLQLVEYVVDNVKLYRKNPEFFQKVYEQMD